MTVAFLRSRKRSVRRLVASRHPFSGTRADAVLRGRASAPRRGNGPLVDVFATSTTPPPPGEAVAKRLGFAERCFAASDSAGGFVGRPQNGRHEVASRPPAVSRLCDRLR